MTDQPPPQPAPLTDRPVLWIILIGVGWLVVLGLTAFTVSRYGVSVSSALPTPTDGESAATYLDDIRDRLAQW